jgi:hypothetical protein
MKGTEDANRIGQYFAIRKTVEKSTPEVTTHHSNIIGSWFIYVKVEG